MKILPGLSLLISLLSSTAAQCPSVCSCFGSTVDCTPRFPEFRLTAIPDDAPSDTQVLIMTGNEISSIPPGNFSPYPQLTSLVLSDNLLTDIPILDIPQLTNLTLDGNPFVSLSDEAFTNLTSLENLFIRRTPLTTLDANTFDGAATTLVNLYLDENPFTELFSDLLMFIPQLQLLSLTNTPLQSLPDGLFTPLDPNVAQVNLVNNPWSCDCNLAWLSTYLSTNNILLNDVSTVCQWPPRHRNQPISAPNSSDFTCYAPTVSQSPQNETVFSNLTLTLACSLDSAPFPTVVWMKDGVALNLSNRVHLEDTYSAALFFESLELSDSGSYQCYVENDDGNYTSSVGEITVLEYTCFDNQYTSEHETDLDCGGEFCVSCDIAESCLLDRDCAEDLVCLFAHELPSMISYITESNPLTYTCANASLPPMLLEAILLSDIPGDIQASGVSALQNETQLQESMQRHIASMLGVSEQVIGNVRLASSKNSLSQRPLVQISFDVLKRMRPREAALARSAATRLINTSELRATMNINDESEVYRIRWNI